MTHFALLFTILRFKKRNQLKFFDVFEILYTFYATNKFISTICVVQKRTTLRLSRCTQLAMNEFQLNLIDFAFG